MNYKRPLVDFAVSAAKAIYGIGTNTMSAAFGWAVTEAGHFIVSRGAGSALGLAAGRTIAMSLRNPLAGLLLEGALMYVVGRIWPKVVGENPTLASIGKRAAFALACTGLALTTLGPDVMPENPGIIATSEMVMPVIDPGRNGAAQYLILDNRPRIG